MCMYVTTPTQQCVGIKPCKCLASLYKCMRDSSVHVFKGMNKKKSGFITFLGSYDSVCLSKKMYLQVLSRVPIIIMLFIFCFPTQLITFVRRACARFAPYQGWWAPHSSSGPYFGVKVVKNPCAHVQIGVYSSSLCNSWMF